MNCRTPHPRSVLFLTHPTNTQSYRRVVDAVRGWLREVNASEDLVEIAIFDRFGVGAPVAQFHAAAGPCPEAGEDLPYPSWRCPHCAGEPM